MTRSNPRRTRRTGSFVTAGLMLGVVLAVAVSAAAVPAESAAPAQSAKHLRALKDTLGTKHLWRKAAKPRRAGGRRVAVHARRYRSLSLNTARLRRVLARAPRERTTAARRNPLVISLPAPNGSFHRFALEESAIMAPGLARRHPEIKTYRGIGLTDRTATIHADISPLGFHASVRSAHGAWYIDPYFVGRRPGVHASYYGREARDTHGPFVEREAGIAELSVDKGYYHAADPVALHGAGFAENAAITITISDPEEQAATRTLAATSDAQGSFDASFVADPEGKLDMRVVEATDGSASAHTSYQVVRDDDPTTDPPTGPELRTYRLAMITDPGYSAYFGGPANVTAAKVALMNRVNQIYQDDLTIRMQFVPNNDLLNLDTYDEAVAPNGPCGAAGCFTQAQVLGCSTGRNRIVIGQIIGASNYDVGHLALGQPGGGVAGLGVVGRQNKAAGCTGLATPVGDFFAVDYVAHELGHQFGGNHTFNGNQLNCSGGNRSAAHSVEPGSGSSVQAYAGICLTDDLQPHSDPYFSQHSQQEMTTYVASAQLPINEVQTVSLRHFGGGNEVQVATLGPGFSDAKTVAPATSTINAVPSATSRGGAMQVGNTVTIATSGTHSLQPGDVATISGVAEPGYNGTFTLTAVPTTRSFQYELPVTGLPVSGGGTVTPAVPGASAVGTTATIRTTVPHNRSVGDFVTITTGGGFAGTFAITAAPSARTFQYELPAPPTTNPTGGGTSTYFSPFRVRFGGNDSALIGGAAQPYSNANLTAAINAIPGFPGANVTGAATTGFTITYTGTDDVPNVQLVDLSCGGCFNSVEETNHGGAFDSFVLEYGGSVSAPIVNGTNYTAAAIDAAIEAMLPVGGTVTVAGFGGGAFNNTGFQITFGGTLAAANNPVLLDLQDFTAGASGFVRETDKGGPVDNGGTVTLTGNNYPVVSAPSGYTIPLRTPFALTGSATDPEGDTILYSWEQNDRGGTAGTSLLINTKTNGPLFAMFPKSAPISESDTLLYNSPNQNHVTTSPTRVFPDLEQILANNTNADTGSCSPGPIAPPVPIPVRECYMEFLPTSDYVGFAGVNLGPPPELHFRLTARDLRMGGGGNSAADTTLTLATTAGPFLVTAPNTAVSYPGGSTQTITWDKANTDLPPVGTTDVKISLSTDGGRNYPHVLAASTPNDGSEAVTIPFVFTDTARVKIEAVGNVFFDVSNQDFTITDTVKPTISASQSPAPNAAGWNNSDVTVTLTATDDAAGSGVKSITYSATGGQPIAATTVNGSSTKVVISGEGVTTLSFFATDNAGNVSDTGTHTVRLDKTAPEAFLRFDPDARDVALFGRDALSGIGSGAIAPTAVNPLMTGDRDLRAERRTYDLADRAGNTLRLVDVVRLTRDDAVATIQTLQYGGGAVTTPAEHRAAVSWTGPASGFKSLEHNFSVSTPVQSGKASWKWNEDVTEIKLLADGVTTKTTVPGMFLLRLATDRGALSIETTP
ncbi:MAG TPA: M12 family metallo-peptidase [Gaiellaceae bacterium]|nr:M12 family metallo-peptidase [Gaiellaceae bacterium]